MDETLLLQLFNNNHSFEHKKIESPIEEILLNHIVKFLKKETEIIIQYPISTISGNFRADIVLKNENKVVIIECDGEEHHTKDRDEWYDEWRDTLILIQKKAQVIYRVKGTDIHNHLYKVFAIIIKFEDDMFDKEYTNRIEKFDIHGDWYKKQIHYDFTNDDGQLIPSMTEVKRKELENDFDSFWYKYILYSLLFKDKNIYELIDKMTSKHYESKNLIVMLNEIYPKLKLENEKQLLTLFKNR